MEPDIRLSLPTGRQADTRLSGKILIESFYPYFTILGWNYPQP